MRVGIVALLHESNTFVSQKTTLEHFENDLLLGGDALISRLSGAHHEVGGFLEGLARARFEAVPLLAARAMPHGVVTERTLDILMRRLFEAFDGAGRLDALLVAAHGATVSEAERDVDGHLLASLRRRLDPDKPLIATLDPHANLSRRMVAASDATIAYRTNPHVDQRQRGLEAAALLERTLGGEVRPTQAAAFPPLAIGIERQGTSEPPCSDIIDAADALLERPGVLSTSVILGFPYADVPEMGASALVVTDNDAELAAELAMSLAGEIWRRRGDLVGRLTGIDEALDESADLLARNGGPVCLLDMGDNVGGGSPGDGTFLARALHERRLHGGFVCLFDPQSVEQATALGAGGSGRFLLGGKTDDLHGAPLDDVFTVRKLANGRFEERRPRHGGAGSFDQGPTAIVDSAHGLTLMLTSKRMAPFSTAQLTSCGLEPAAFRLIVAKGVHAPVAAYEEFAARFVRVDTPGVTTADMTRLDYRERRRPMFPFEPDATWTPGA